MPGRAAASAYLTLLVALSFLLAVDALGGPKVPRAELQVDDEIEDQMVDVHQAHLDKEFMDHVSETEMHRLFNKADRNNDGQISETEFQEVMAEDRREPLPQHPLNHMNEPIGIVETGHLGFRDLDLNGNGYGSFREAKVFFQKMVEDHRRTYHAQLHSEL